MELVGFKKVSFHQVFTRFAGKYRFLDPEVNPRDIPIQVTHVNCTGATSITDCKSSGWGRGQGDFYGCHYENVLWVSCEK